MSIKTLKKINLGNVDAFIFDFDGVLTNNFVQVDEFGNESVSCSRSDGLAFDVLRKLKRPVYILSTEKNPVVEARSNKLKVKLLQGVSNKSKTLKELADMKGYDVNKILYVGNDLNDYYVMKICGYSICPSDSHEKIKEISDVVLKTAGGKGIVRELLEEVINLDFISILFDDQYER